MSATPSEHPLSIVENVRELVYLTDFHDQIEQSAIYEDVHFSSVGEKDFAIVLTSQCDIQGHSPNNYVLVARIVPVGEVFVYWLVEKNQYTEDEALGRIPVAKEKKRRSSLVKEFANTYLRNETFAYFFLPEIESKMDPSLICFEITECMILSKLQQHEKVAVLRSPFREAVPSHYSAYIGRTGTPSFDKRYLQEVVNHHCKVQDS